MQETGRRRRALRWSAVGVLAAQVASAFAADDSEPGLGAVIVTGARGVTRTVDSSPTPIDVLTTTDIELANKPNLLETLATLLPSLNLPVQNTFGGGVLVRGPQLRGLNPDHTLVLINGKRRHGTALLGAGGFATSAGADLALIPSGAVERIEVLRDGASALYGSDAIAGVINIITKKQPEGGSLSIRGGEHYKGDGTTWQLRGDAGFAIGNGGHVHIAGQIDDQQPAFRDFPVPSSFLYYFPTVGGVPVAPAGSLASNPRLPAGATPDPREATRNNNPVFGIGGIQESTLYSGLVDIGLPINGDVELYGVFTYAHRTGRSPQYFRHPSRDENVRAIYPDGFTPFSGIKENDYAVTAGLRGEDLFGWGWDVSSGYGRSAIESYVYNSVSPTFGLQSQTDFFLGERRYGAWTTNLDLRRTLKDGLLGVPADVSVGAEYRRETFENKAGDVQSWGHGGQSVLDGPRAGTALGRGFSGSQADSGIRPEDVVDASRNSRSVYGGLTLKPAQNWVIDVAGRVEDYSDFGGTETGRLSSRWDVTPAFALRGTLSTGFHAPALAAQSFRSISVTNDFTSYTFQVDSPEARALGAKDLKPETSVNVSLGFTARLTDKVNLAVDAYQIDVKDRIARSTAIREALYPGAGALVAAAGLNPNDSVSYFINAADSRTRGVDVTLDGSFRLKDAGLFRWSAAYNHNSTEVTDIASTPGVLAALNVPVFSEAAQNTLRYLAPRQKAIFTVNWKKERWSAQLRQTWFGEIKRIAFTSASVSPPVREIEYDIGRIWVTDLSVGYDFDDNLNLTLSASNLFNEKPNKLPRELLLPFQSAAYVNNGPITGAGGFYSATLSYRW